MFLALGIIFGLLAFSTNAFASEVDRLRQACTDGRVLKLGFFSDFKPVSYSENPTPGTAGFDRHRGYEADLLTALEAMEDEGLSFRRRGIGVWPGIWLTPAGTDFDVVGGGITILDSRTRNDANENRDCLYLGTYHVSPNPYWYVRRMPGASQATTISLTRASACSVGPPANTGCWS